MSGLCIGPGGVGAAVALVWLLRQGGSSWLHVKSTTFFFYPVHNRSCNHDPTKFAAGPGIGGGPVGESSRTEVGEIGPCGFLRWFPGDSGTSSDGWEYG